MKYRALLIFSFLLSLFVTGCTKETLSDCAIRTAFRCSFELNNEHTDQFSKLVNQVDLYIFDVSGLLIRHISQTQERFPEGHTIAVDLKYGVYTAVLYGTIAGNDEVVVGLKQGDLSTALAAMQVGESHMSDMRLMLNSVTGQTDRDLEVVLHGMVSQFTVAGKSETHNVPFIRDTHVVELNISGLEYLMPQPGSLPDVAVRIEGNNKAYLYDNSLDMELGKVIHAPYWQEYSNDLLVSRLSVLRLFKEHPMTLKIYSGGHVIWQLNLTAEIMKSPSYATNEDLDREDQFVVAVKVTTTGDITVVVNGWTTTTAGEIIG